MLEEMLSRSIDLYVKFFQRVDRNERTLADV